MVDKRASDSLRGQRGGQYLQLKHSPSSVAKRKSVQCGLRPTPSNAAPYKGVRMRVWGKWVTEIRDPVTKIRIWLGSFATAELAARAHDAAVVCLKGASASEINFPDSIPSFVIQQRNSSPKEIQALALAAATASVPAAAPLAMARPNPELAKPRPKKCEAFTEVPAGHEFDRNGNANHKNCDGMRSWDKPEFKCSKSSNVENWIHCELDFDDVEATAEVVDPDPLIELSEFVDPPFPPLLTTASIDSEDAEDVFRTHHDMGLWSFA